MSLLEPYQSGISPLHRLDARVKVLWTLAYILSLTLIRDGMWGGFAGLAVLWLMAARASALPLRRLLTRGLVALPFALAAFTVLLHSAGTPLLDVRLGPVHMVITDRGVTRFVSILLRSWLGVLAAVLLLATTRFPDVLVALRALRVPPALVNILGVTYRYLFVLAEEAGRMMRGRTARSAVPDTIEGYRGGSLVWRARVTGTMAGTLFLRSLERSERIYHAMLSRGFDGEWRTIAHPRLQAREIAVGVGGGLVLAALVVVTWVVG